MPSPLDEFVPTYDAREYFQIRVNAPAELVYQIAAHFDLDSIPLVHGIFWLRTKLMAGGAVPSQPFAEGLIAGAKRLGWGALSEVPGRLFVAGAYCQPWYAQVTFHPLAADTFSPFAEPAQVKIAWTLEASPLDAARSLLATETRAIATDPWARRHFRRYWAWARFGIFPIRWLLLPAVRRQAEREARLRAAKAV
ncbi:MAG TPA: hypothetical protein VMG41_15270 [Gemmatimonadales bacterium]|nr:hypothetical protein [Gemmatimonadales bacterium]